MAPRPYWRGYLKLSLVSCAVALFPASSKSERISFHWLNRETGSRLRQQMIDEQTGEPVDREDRVRGYQLGKNDYLTIEEEELESVEIESSHTIEIERFVHVDEIDPVYLENAYYLAPDDKVAEEAFSVIREAMAEEGVAGIARVVLARRERLVVLEPRERGIVVTTLHYAYEVRNQHNYFDEIPEIKISDEMLDLAKHIIRSKLDHFNVAEFRDRYEDALVELIRAKQAGRPVEHRRIAQPSNVINLMDALRKSIAGEKAGKGGEEAPSDEEEARPASYRTRGAEPASGRSRAAKPPARKAAHEKAASEKTGEEAPRTRRRAKAG